MGKRKIAGRRAKTKGTKTPPPIAEIVGCNVFNDAVMRERLPAAVYKTLRRTIDEGAELDRSIADVVAGAMKEWAIEKGATHFTHWFQPMTGVTAEKHDSFISPTADGRAVMEFGGKELIKGEPDASSFPSGGLRATFEARGYTAWDCTSPAFVRALGGSVTLCIPTVFCSYTGLALDKKTPLLRSLEALNKHALRVLRAFGDKKTKRVYATAGPEQEYFLVDRSFYEGRLDLMMAGRTLFGAPPPKGQEMEDHYFGSIKERVADFMGEVNTELWKLGVSAKTQHNEVAPGQFEIAPVFSHVNIATDHNQLTMDVLRKVAVRHGLECLLHEKPYAGVNGSGKHNNWSLATDGGQNLLEPGRTPHDNAQFLVFLSAVLFAVDKYGKLLRASVSVPGNDHRLGANEAPPAIVSVFLGEQLTEIVRQLAAGDAASSKQHADIKIGVSTLPPLPKDVADRNRTSSFAFTGNKFEFRMVGSSMSVAGPNFALNTMVADALARIAEELEGAGDLNSKVQAALSRIAREHGRIVFNGNNYSREWVEEARRRGLPNIRSAVEGIEAMMDPEIVELFERHGVLSRVELEARCEVMLETYCKTINIEALTMIQMAGRQILPAAAEFAGRTADGVNAVKAAGADPAAQARLLGKLCGLIGSLEANITRLEEAHAAAAAVADLRARAENCRDRVVPAMAALREDADRLEEVVDADLWPVPTYAEMLFLI